MKINSSIFSSSNKILNNNARIGLAISAGIAIFISIIGLIITLIYKRKLKNKYISPDEEIEIEKLKIKNPNYGIILDGIKKFYNDYSSDFLVAFLVNTIYLNDYKNIYINDDDDYLAISCANLCISSKTFLEPSNKFEPKYMQIKSENLEKINNLSSYELLNKNTLNSKKMFDYDIYIIMNQALSFKETLEKYVSSLNDKKMLIISYQNLKDIINEKEYLKNNNIKYETINFDNKNVILLAKENLKSKFINNKEEGL